MDTNNIDKYPLTCYHNKCCTLCSTTNASRITIINSQLMHITYHGLSCFKLIAKTAGRGSEDLTIIFAPYDKNFGLRPPQGNADMIIIPHQSPMFNNTDTVRGTPVIVDRPGEFSVKGVNIVGKDAPADMRGGVTRGNTTIYIIDIEDMRIAYLGAILVREPSPADHGPL
jgi:hypothetical protein